MKKKNCFPSILSFQQFDTLNYIFHKCYDLPYCVFKHFHEDRLIFTTHFSILKSKCLKIILNFKEHCNFLNPNFNVFELLLPSQFLKCAKFTFSEFRFIFKLLESSFIHKLSAHVPGLMKNAQKTVWTIRNFFNPCRACKK